MMEMARLLMTPDGRRLVSGIKRLVESQGLPAEQVLHDSIEHMERLEALARQRGKTVKQVADESLALYEAEAGPVVFQGEEVEILGLRKSRAPGGYGPDPTCICQVHPQMTSMFVRRGYKAWECPQCLRILIRSLFTGHQMWYVPEGGGGR